MAKSSSRLVSLDIFRGLTVAFMIIVNTPGSWQYVYSPLRHAKWHGCTPTDLGCGIDSVQEEDTNKAMKTKDKSKKIKVKRRK